jgi:hypothetical protein
MSHPNWRAASRRGTCETSCAIAAKELREILVERIGQYVRNPDELFEELRELFGI